MWQKVTSRIFKYICTHKSPKITRDKPSIRYQFEIFHLRRMIEGFHVRGFMKVRSQSTDYITILQVIQYTKLVYLYHEVNFRISIQFWSVLLSENITGNQIFHFGKELIYRKRQGKKNSELLMEDLGYNLHFLYKFMVFQHRILHNEHLSYESLNKIKILSENN